MAKDLKQQSRLSEKMQRLKNNILALLLERKSLMEKVYEGSRFATIITTGISNVFNVIASFLSSFQSIPIIGGIFQGIAAIPQAISFISDPKITLAQKAISGLLLAVVGGIALTAFLLGSVATLIFGTVLSSVLTLLEGYYFTYRVIDKFQKSKRYNERNEFMTLIEERRYPEDDKYNDQLEIRAVELKHALAGNGLSKDKKRKIEDELGFINGVLNKKGIVIGENPESTASQLSELYKIHKEQLQELTEKLSLITEETKLEGHNEILDEIQKIQKAILTTEEDIAYITKPINELLFENEMATDKLGLSFSNFALSAAAAIVSILGLLVGVGVVVAPPTLVPVMLGIGISLAVVGLVKWIAEKITQQTERNYLAKKEEHQKVTILEESLYAYEHTRYKNHSASIVDSSHSKYMQDLLEQKNTIETEKEPAETSSLKPNEQLTFFGSKKDDSAKHPEDSHQVDGVPLVNENMTP
ncbi:T4SS effector SidA family protein [Legionella bononiensis]|uniref:T4SS effector SidA family protein n=1 Tax=Legionella bononiensis TaxID=2793102 RepID=A0ABS1WFE1_9GAMM|nr:T4SS effector SidA family protein [Legionella bononiensis]MBL7479200.1 T4SS effector SidA family protein [Legionella bononiensis]MBL7528074.1 T4SS effector SidA family protein [Legionella bononiensis]MBL7563850.1 T4SS effector SidA family protein [Legionella bononiensis]